MKGSIDAGQVRALGTTGDKRSADPARRADRQRGRRAGLRGHDLARHHGARRARRKEIVDRLNAEIGKVIAKPAIREAWAKQGAVPMTMTPAEFGAFLQQRHRQVGEGRQGLRRQGAVMPVLRILAGGAAQALVEKARPGFEAPTGCTIDGTFSAVGAMRDKLLAGEPADIVILSRALIDELARSGHVVRLVDHRCRPGRDRRRGAQRRSPARDRRQGRAGARRSRRPTRSTSPIRRRRPPASTSPR